MQEKRDFKREESYKWRKSVVLTPAEGKEFENIVFPDHDCENLSQLCKKIARKEILLLKNEK